MRMRTAARILASLLFAAAAIPAAPQQVDQPQPPDVGKIQEPAPPPSAPQPSPDTPGSIHGTVVDHDGTVYEGVHISLLRPVSHTTQSTLSDSNGRFEFTTVSPGPFELTASADGFVPHQVVGTLHPGENYEAPAITMAFATASTEVRVTASQVEIAQAQLKEEEQQRIFGFVPNFYVVYTPNPAPLTPKQKFHLAWRTLIDPTTFLITGASAGVEQATDAFSGYGQGAEGYAKRFGANYADNVTNTLIGGAFLPSILKQDPRYYYKGTGSIRSRALYAIANAFVCKGDNGHWQFNYSGLGGGIGSAAISNLYYPEKDRDGITLTVENLLIGFGYGAAQNLFQEFLVRRLTPNLPPHNSSKP